VFAVCHADDEALWAGALLHGLSQFPDVELDVICFSGGDVRAAEFARAQEVAGYRGGVVLDLPLRPAPEPLPETGGLLEQGLEKVGRRADEIDLLVTHSPYGDEHLNPHHRQAFRELHSWSSRHEVPFGYFTTVSNPFVLHRSLLTDLRRHEKLHAMQFARCRPTARGLFLTPGWRALAFFRYFAQFLGDYDVKRRMLECYASVDLAAFEAGYAMYTSACESLYVQDERGGEVIRRILAAMSAPSPVDLFGQAAFATAVAARAYELKPRRVRS
jgi:LmbE family N-acetylglucosaminyl deacetylase